MQFTLEFNTKHILNTDNFSLTIKHVKIFQDLEIIVLKINFFINCER